MTRFGSFLSSPSRRALLLVSACAALAFGQASSTRAQTLVYDPNACDAPGDSPDVIVGDVYQLQRYGHVGNITSFAIGTYSCNVGTCWLNWITGSGSNQHPTIGQNAFRLKNGRFEQIGQSWLKHGFYALSDELCMINCLATDGEHLGVNCSDPYNSGLNGQQNRLGPKFEVNVATGSHPHPVTDQALTGDAIYKRLQIHDNDLDPAMNTGALYFVEGQYIAQDDRVAGNEHNNASYRQVRASTGGPGNFDLAFAGTTQRTKPGILAWRDNDPNVQVRTVDDADGGRFYVAGRVTDLGGGTWHYEYAVQNLDSQRAGGTFTVPVPSSARLTNIAFHDVDYHSGEPFDLTDWTNNNGAGGKVVWNTIPFATNNNANAIRWGTLYNFRFDCDRPPGTNLVTVGLFKPTGPGEADKLVVSILAPDTCNGNSSCDADENCVSCPTECSADPGPDNDSDGIGYCVDCDDNSPRRWAIPNEATMLMAHRGPAGEVVMDWLPPTDPGDTNPTYEAVRSTVASDFASSITCVRAMDPETLTVSDMDAPAAGPLLFYLVRARSTCAIGMGTTGGNSFGVERLAADCQ